MTEQIIANSDSSRIETGPKASEHFGILGHEGYLIGVNHASGAQLSQVSDLRGSSEIEIL